MPLALTVATIPCLPFQERMQQIMLQCFLAAKHKLDRKLGYFDLIGCDFLIDENFKVGIQYRQILGMLLARCPMPAAQGG